MEKKKTDGHGLVISYIAETLSIPLVTFCGWLSDEFEEDVSEYTLLRAARGQRIRWYWTFDEFFEKVDSAVQMYCENEIMDSKQREAVISRWTKEKENIKKDCKLFFTDVDTVEHSQGDVEIRNQLLGLIEHIFRQLDKPTAYKLQRDFIAYVSVLPDDLMFLNSVLNKEAVEKDSILRSMLQKETVNAGTMLEYLKSDEVRHWVNIRNESYTDQCRKDRGKKIETIWEDFVKQYDELSYVQASTLFHTLLIIFLWPLKYGDNPPDTVRFGEKEIDMLLLFKYCLTAQAREETLQELK